jgi:hypothetical protein
MAEEQWVIEFTDASGKFKTFRPMKTKDAALGQARDLIRHFCTVKRIVGSNIVIDQVTIQKWIKDHPE